MKLIADPAKVEPWLKWLAARGQELAKRPVSDEASLRRALADYQAWSATVGESLARAFDGRELAALRGGPPPLGRAGLRSRVRLDLAVLMVAQAIVGPQIQQPPDEPKQAEGPV